MKLALFRLVCCYGKGQWSGQRGLGWRLSQRWSIPAPWDLSHTKFIFHFMETKQATTAYELNVQEPSRKPKYSTTSHSCGVPINLDKHGKLTFNQYTKPKDIAESWDLAYQYLMYGVQEEQRGLFTCWVPEGAGIDAVDEDDHYKRMSFKGSRPQCHGFVWAYHHPGVAKNGDVSHLCGYGFCCRPSHLMLEDRTYQLTRRNCPGYIEFIKEDDLVEFFLYCEHNPRCKVSTVLSWSRQEPEPVDN